VTGAAFSVSIEGIQGLRTICSTIFLRRFFAVAQELISMFADLHAHELSLARRCALFCTSHQCLLGINAAKQGDSNHSNDLRHCCFKAGMNQQGYGAKAQSPAGDLV
jgi:hypothetical protein